jgi:histidinol-phosphate aminotransferase
MPLPASPDVSPITDYLSISAWPRGDHAEEIRAMNVRLILSMHWIKPSRKLASPPVRLLWLPTFDNTLAPMPISTLQRGVEAALPVIGAGHRVLVHCRAGVHRSVAMACCVLIGNGYTADAAMHLVVQQRPVADPHAKHIEPRIYQFERFWLVEG